MLFRSDVVGLLEVELSLLGAVEEGAEDRLDDVLGVDAAGEALADALACQQHELLGVTVEELPGRVLVACDAAGRTIGVAAVVPEGETADLDVMFVDPPAIGGGAGRALFEAAAALARSLGALRLTILADPNAAPFYQRMGARFLCNAPSDAIPGRTLPLYEYDLTPETVA